MRTPSSSRTHQGAVPPRPALTVVAGAREVDLAASGEATVGDLASTLGYAAPRPLWINGRWASPRDQLVGSGLVHGSEICDAPPPEPVAATVALQCTAGPSTGVRVPLPPGRHLLGRGADTAILIDDPELEWYAAVVEARPDGSVHFTQLAGRAPAMLDGAHVCGAVMLERGAVVELGSSRFALVDFDPTSEAAVTSTVGSHPWHRVLHRQPRVLTEWAPESIPVPAEPASPARGGEVQLGWISTAFALLGGVVVAVVMSSVLFLVLGVCAAAGSAVVCAVRGISRRRRARHERDRYAAEVATFEIAVEGQKAAFADHLRSTVPAVHDLVAAVQQPSCAVWARRRAHPDAFEVSFGLGAVDWSPEILASPGTTPDTVDRPYVIDDAPATTRLGPGDAIAVTGDGAPLVRALIVQLAVTMGPADWELVLVVDEPHRWAWCRWLPHLHHGAGEGLLGADDSDAIAAALDLREGHDARSVVVVTDRPDVLATRTGPMRRFLAGTRPSALCVLSERAEEVPSVCKVVVHVRSRGRARWTPDATLAPPNRRMHLVGITEPTARLVARRLARLVDPEAAETAADGVPRHVGLIELLNPHGGGRLTADAVEQWWVANDTARELSTPLGAGDGVVAVDLVADGPHVLVGGTTGAGKSELLRSLVAGLAARYRPARLNLVLVDYKGGSTFDACALLPHTVGVVTDLDDHLGERALRSLRAELRWREEELRRRGIADLVDDQPEAGRAPIARLVVVIDEFAAMAAELPGFLHSLVGIAQRGRSLGVHLILATQRPAGVVSDDIRANTNLRLALRLHDVADARDVVGDDAPASFPRSAPGRAMMRLGEQERLVFQVASCLATAGAPDRRPVVADRGDGGAPDGPRQLDVLVRAVCEAADRLGDAPAHRPWLEPLPEILPHDGYDGSVIERGAIGVLDAPEARSRPPLAWSPGDGNLVLLGSRGSGTTATLETLMRTLARDRRPDDLHVYVVDTVGDPRLRALEAMPHCAAVIGIGERERLGRLVGQLDDELRRRRNAADGECRPDIVWCVDGFGAVRELDGPLVADSIGERLMTVLDEGPAVGITAVLVVHSARGVSAALTACPVRWMLHVDDPTEAMSVGARPTDVPPAVPGRLFDVGRQLEGQVVAPMMTEGQRSRDSHARSGPPGIGVLGSFVALATLAPSAAISADGAKTSRLVIGRRFDDLGDAALTIRDGEHVLVAGSARSGRSTALATLTAAWRGCHPDGVVSVVDPSCPETVDAVDELDPAIRRLVVVDNAERVDDRGGALARLVEQRQPTITIAAAIRPCIVRSDYSHWTRLVARGRLGVVLTAGNDADGDVLGEPLPRRMPILARPGLAYVVQDGAVDLVQIAVSTEAGRDAPTGTVRSEWMT